MAKIRVLVVDDAVVMRRLITEALARDPAIEVAAHGRIALARIPQLNPDVITLDVEMQEMDGIATVRAIRETYPNLPVILFSPLTERGAAATLDALSAGATDYVIKPANAGIVGPSLQRLAEELASKIRLHARHLLPTPPVSPVAASQIRPLSPVFRPLSSGPIELICIGSSTGGPSALAGIFSQIPTALPVPVVITQHMPVLFTKMLAARLDRIGGMRFSEGADGEFLEAGHAYLAPGGRHLEVVSVAGALQIRLHDQPPENSCRPSVDVLFRSVAAACGGKVLALMLTGMGQDGLHGCRHLRERHAQILAQDEESSVIWDMPGVVAQAGLADRILPLDQIATEINRRVPVRVRTSSDPFSVLA